MEGAERQPRAYPRTRLLVAGLLFLGWLGYLGYLVVQTRTLVVVSRPQVLISPLVVVAEVADDGGRPARTVTVTRVLYPGDRNLAGAAIRVEDLPDVTLGYEGPGEYVLPLRNLTDGDNLLTPLPRVPGFEPAGQTRIYAVSDDVLAQVREVLPE
jgi:hypothetical protein